MTAIITQKTKGLFMRRLKNDADALSTAHDLDSSDNKYYIAIGKSEDWNDSDNVANASPLITEREERDFRLSMQSVKTAADVSFVVPKVPWSSGNVYQAFDDTMVSHGTTSQNGSYVIIDNNQVYLCVRTPFTTAGAAKASLVSPSGTSTKPFTTSDDYAWKFLYTVGVSDNSAFTTANFMPVKKINKLDSDGSGTVTSNSTDVQLKGVQDAAMPKPIAGFELINGGAGYDNAPTVTIVGNGLYAEAETTVSGSKVTSVTLKDDSAGGMGIKHGRDYDYAHVVFTPTGGDTITSVATARVKLGPKDGYGADPRIDLRSKAMMFNTKPSGTETNNSFHVGTSFRQIALMKNLKDSNGLPFTAQSGNALRRLKLSSLTTAFTKGSLMTGGTSGAQGYVGHTDSDEIWYHQNETTKFTPFQGSETVTDAAGGEGAIANIARNNVMGDVDPFSGEVLYIENRAKVVRAADQTEDIKVIIEI